MKPIRLATLGIIAAGAMFGAVAASAAPIGPVGPVATTDNSMVTLAGYRYRCWWSYGHRYCRRVYYRPYYRYYRY
jgi:hypothetical protein